MVAISGLASRLARLVVKAELTDPLSGFFLITRDAFAAKSRTSELVEPLPRLRQRQGEAGFIPARPSQ